MQGTAPRRALILFAHGSRDPTWRESVDAIAHRIHALEPAVPVSSAFLEFMQPTLEAAVAGAVASGIARIHVVPVFLGAGKHVRDDLPQMMDRLSAAHPGCELMLEPWLGDSPEILDAAARVCLEAIS